MAQFQSLFQRMRRLAIASLATVSLIVVVMTNAVFAQTGRPVSGVIAATDRPIAVSYVNEDGERIGRIAGVGEPIYLNDEISTPDGASLQILLRDQTVFSIGPNSTLVFDEFIFDPTSVDDVALTASVKKGTFKFISGKISKLKPGAMTLKLPNATASVRGTSVVGRVDDSGASDIILLTGAVALETVSAPAVDLIQPGWGVSVGEAGIASAPTQFSAEEIESFIQEVETGADEGASDGEIQTADAQTDEASEEEPSEEAVDSVANVVREAGAEVSEEEITTIIQEADGNPEAVAEAIVKVIIENRIESGDIDSEALAEFEAFVTAQAGAETDENGAFIPQEFAIEELNVADLKVEDLGIEGFGFGGDDSFVEAFSQRLDTQVLALPKFDEAQFGFDAPEFEEVKFDFASFNRADIAVTQRFDIKEVSNLIIGNEFDSAGDAPEIELSFFDILFNAEAINQEVSRRETSFSFNIPNQNFDDGKEQAPEDAPAPNFDDAPSFGGDDAKSDDVPFVSPLLFERRVDENGEIKTVFQRPSFDDGKTETAPEAEADVPSFGEADLFLSKVVQQEPGYDSKDDVPSFQEQAEYLEKRDDAKNELLDLISRVQLDSARGTLDPLEYYKSGDAQAQWLTLQSDGSLGNNDTFDGMISSSYQGSVRFTDSFTVQDTLTTFKARASYDITLDYGTAAVTGSFALSNMTLNGDTYYSAANTTSHEETISNLSLSGRSNANGTLSTGGTVEEVNIASVDFHDSTTASEITTRIRTTLDMSAGSTQVYRAALDGTLGEFTVEAETFNCNPNCTTSTGLVGRGVSQVAGE